MPAANRKLNNHKKGVAENERQHRKIENEERLAAHSKLTVQQKIDKLDKQLGVGVGAKRQRERYRKQLATTTA